MSESSEHRSASRSNRWFVVVVSISMIVLLLIGGSVIVGLVTAKGGWAGSVSTGGDYLAEHGGWFRPDCIAVMYVGGAMTEPYAIAVHDALKRHGWGKRVLLMEPGDPADVAAHDHVDYFIVIGRPVSRRTREGMQWRNEIDIPVCGGVTPWDMHWVGPDTLPIAVWVFLGKIQGDGFGMGMRINRYPDTDSFAEQILGSLREQLDPAKATFSPERPAAFFGRPAPPQKISVLDEFDAQMIWSGPDYLRNQRAFWLVHASGNNEDVCHRFARLLQKEGWKADVFQTNGLGWFPSSQWVVCGRQGDRKIQFRSAPRNGVVHPFWADSVEAEQTYLVEYSQQFSSEQMRKAMDLLLHSGSTRELGIYRPWMTTEQRKRVPPTTP